MLVSGMFDSWLSLLLRLISLGDKPIGCAVESYGAHDSTVLCQFLNEVSDYSGKIPKALLSRNDKARFLFRQQRTGISTVYRLPHRKSSEVL